MTILSFCAVFSVSDKSESMCVLSRHLICSEYLLIRSMFRNTGICIRVCDSDIVI